MSSEFNCNHCPYKAHSDNHKQITTDSYNVRVQFTVDLTVAEIQEHAVIERAYLVFWSLVLSLDLGRIACHSSTLLVNEYDKE